MLSHVRHLPLGQLDSLTVKAPVYLHLTIGKLRRRRPRSLPGSVMALAFPTTGDSVRPSDSRQLELSEKSAQVTLVVVRNFQGVV